MDDDLKDISLNDEVQDNKVQDNKNTDNRRDILELGDEEGNEIIEDNVEGI